MVKYIQEDAAVLVICSLVPTLPVCRRKGKGRGEGEEGKVTCTLLAPATTGGGRVLEKR